MSSSMVQIKFTLESDIVDAFKKRCTSDGVSMASVIRQFMSECSPEKPVETKINTRQHRKKAVHEVIGLLDRIVQEEETYRDRIPEAFQTRYETADQTCDQLTEAISSLEDAY